MKLFGLFFSICFLMGNVSAQAAPNKKEFKAKVKNLVLQYEMSKAKQEAKMFSFLRTDDGRDCPPPSFTSCVNAVCNHMPAYECDQPSETQRVAEMCRGVNGQCVEGACSHLPAYECDQPSEMQEITAMCRGSQGNCVGEVCTYLPSYECDQKSEIGNIARMCQGVEDGCVTAVCSHLPSYECDQPSEMQEVTRQCKGE